MLPERNADATLQHNADQEVRQRNGEQGRDGQENDGDTAAKFPRTMFNSPSP